MAGSVRSYQRSDKGMLHLVRNCQNVSQVGCASWPAQQQCVKMTAAPPLPALGLITGVRTYVHMYILVRFSHSSMCVMASQLV